jgi:UDP-N-acetylglucosamine 4-epimerase
MVQLLKEHLSVYDAQIAAIPVLYGTARKGDIPHSLASIKKAKDILGYEPLVHFEEGLKKTVDWYWPNTRR